MSDIACVITVQGTNWVAFITEEVNLVEILVFKPTKSVRLVPTTRENIKWELATDSESQSIIREFFLEDLNKFCSIAILLCLVISAARKRVYELYLVKSFEFNPFQSTTVFRQLRRITIDMWPDLALRPIGLTLIIPWRNSTKVPLVR